MLAPCSANAFAIANPNPAIEPVTTAVLFLRCTRPPISGYRVDVKANHSTLKVGNRSGIPPHHVRVMARYNVSLRFSKLTYNSITLEHVPHVVDHREGVTTLEIAIKMS